MANIFEGITPESQVALSKNLESNKVTLKKGTALSKILYQNVFGLVLSGHAQIIREDFDGNRIVIEDLTDDMVFGTTISSLSSEDCSLVAKEDCLLLVIDYDRIINNRDTSIDYIKFVKNILNITTEEVNKKNTRIEILTKKTIRGRLLEYFNIFGRNNYVHLPFTYTDLADYLAVDRCSMMRELKNLKTEGFIQTKGRTIKLKM